MTTQTYPLVCVYWKDITVDCGWVTLEQLQKWGKDSFNETCKTVGYLVHESKDYVIVASSCAIFTDSDIQFNNPIMIMSSVITKIVTLTEKKKR